MNGRRPTTWWRNITAILVISGGFLWGGCGSGTGTTSDVSDPGDEVSSTISTPLVDNYLWTEVPYPEDPFWPEAEAPDNACPEENYAVEDHPDGAWFEVYTDTCAYLTVKQPLLQDVAVGATVVVRIWHFSISEGDTAFHLAVGLGETAHIIWEIDVPVPSGSGLLYDELIMETAFSAGEPVYFHLSNHGSNSWGFIEFSEKTE